MIADGVALPGDANAPGRSAPRGLMVPAPIDDYCIYLVSSGRLEENQYDGRRGK